MLSNAGDQLPIIPFKEVVGNAANAAPEQIGATAVNAGETVGFTLMTSVVVVAHCPEFGVKVYVVVWVLSRAGDQLPVIPLSEVDGKAAKAVPAQIAGTVLNDGIVFEGLTVIIIVVETAHCPVFGVKVYVVVCVLSKTGDQLPVMPFSEVVGNAVNVDPEQIGATAAKVGIVFAALTEIVIVAFTAHCPAVGVKV